MDGAALVHLTEILVCVGVTIQAVETLVTRKLYAIGGFYDWQVLATNNRWMLVGPSGALLRNLFAMQPFMALIALQLAAALLVLTDAAPSALSFLIGIILAVHMLFLLRNQYGLDGSDQMMLLVLWALFLYHLHPTPHMLTISLAFICGQFVLSYFTSGGVKAISPVWRRGEAVKAVLSTNSYGSRWLSRFLLDHNRIAVASCWTVILFECIGPLLIWTDPGICLAIIFVGMAFHFSIATFMGLNVFFWSFVSTYPAVYYCASHWSLHAF